jgi:hypothetical protein
MEAIPPSPLLDAMTRTMSPLIDQFITNRIQSHTLAISDLTGPMVEKAARTYVKKEGLVLRQKVKSRTPDHRAKAIRSVVSLRAVLDKLPEPGRFKLLIEGIRMLLGVDDTGADLVEAQAVEVGSETPIDATTTPSTTDEVQTVEVESETPIEDITAPPPTPDKVPDAATKTRRTPKPRQSPTPAKKIATRTGRKSKAA